MRVKTGFTRHRKHKRVLEMTKGYWGSRSKTIRSAKESMFHSGEYAFAGRKRKKRDFRKLWIIKINAGLTGSGLSYSKFINALNKSGITINRKMLADMAQNDKSAFDKIVSSVK